MPRQRAYARELQKGRAWEWRERMADRVRLADGTELDMLDPESIRAYVRKQLALTVDPTSAQLARLGLLKEHAAELEAEAAAKKPADDRPKLPPEEAARLIRMKLQERG